MIWGTLADVALALAIDGAPRFDPSPRYIGGVVYLALIGSVVTFPLYFQLIRDSGPGRAAYNGVVVPVIAMALSTLFEGYRWSLLAGAGGAGDGRAAGRAERAADWHHASDERAQPLAIGGIARRPAEDALGLASLVS